MSLYVVFSLAFFAKRSLLEIHSYRDKEARTGQYPVSVFY